MEISKSDITQQVAANSMMKNAGGLAKAIVKERRCQ